MKRWIAPLLDLDRDDDEPEPDPQVAGPDEIEITNMSDVGQRRFIHKKTNLIRPVDRN